MKDQFDEKTEDAFNKIFNSYPRESTYKCPVTGLDFHGIEYCEAETPEQLWRSTVNAQEKMLAKMKEYGPMKIVRTKLGPVTTEQPKGWRE